jgi:antitoxin component of RelBE/YafQ-DinJ toxin-antitoxin module
MTTQVIFKIDQKLKDQAMKKAKSEGLPFGAVLKLATKAFVDGTLSVNLAPTKVFNERASRMIEKELKDIKEGKNMSPAFNNAKDAINYLKRL